MFGRTLILRAHLASARSFSTTSAKWAGHSKWSKIKDKKGATDTQKSLLYGKAFRDIIVAAKTGGSADPGKNVHLATIVKKYKDGGVPRENIEKALAKASSKEKGGGGESVTYEAMAFGSVGIVVECLTDNTTRTIHNVRHALSRHDARLAPVKFMFERKGRVTAVFDKSVDEPEKMTEGLIETALLAEAEDFDYVDHEEQANASLFQFICQPESLSTVTEAVSSFNPAAVKLESSELIYRGTETIESSEEMDTKVSALVQELESDEDVLSVWTSLDSR
ncbi:transcriptional regulator TACO1-like protein [Coprinopsis sp. MPI-PUGE-AT-0042]|nr:transcriptional regulator TACO1-like protein [Coprinopsis sp. MPI-PUGE-AT-0042]